MPNLYLQAKDYALYGLPASATPDLVIKASLLIDAFLARPEGLLSSDGDVMDATGRRIIDTFVVPRRGRVALSRRPAGPIKRLETTDLFGGIWRDLDFSGLAAEEATGEFFLPATVGWPSRARVSYISGWTYTLLPSDVKLATALLAMQGAEFDGLSANIRRATVGDTSYERFAAGGIDSEVMSLLADYRRVT